MKHYWLWPPLAAASFPPRMVVTSANSLKTFDANSQCFVFFPVLVQHLECELWVFVVFKLAFCLLFPALRASLPILGFLSLSAVTSRPPARTLLVATLLFVNFCLPLFYYLLSCTFNYLLLSLCQNNYCVVFLWVFFLKNWLSLATLQTTTGLASYMSQVANICESQHIFSPISRAAICHVIFQSSLILCFFSTHAFLCPSCHLGFHWWEYCNWNTEAAVCWAFAHYCQWDKSYLPVLHAIRSDTWLHWLF